jgi:restriction endonuclease S subunit
MKIVAEFIENKDIKNIDEVYNGYTYFKEGDILLAKVTPCFENGNLGIAKNLKNGIGFGTTEVHVIRAKKDSRKFIYYLFQNKHFMEKGNSEMYGAGGLKRIPSDFVENYVYPRPDYQTQVCISNYLYQKTAEIDEIINKKEKLIDYLEKYKKSVITEAVTKGKLGDKYINEDGELVDEIEMKDSGVEWIGEIPNYWDIKRLKFVVDEINEKWDENSFYEYIGLENIKSDGGKLTGTQSSENINSAIKFKKDDVLFSTLRPYLRKCIVADFEGICTSEMLVLRGDDNFPQLLSHIMLSNKFIELVNSSTYGAKMPRANWDFIGNIYIPIFNKDIQKEIIDFLDFKISSIYNLINKTKKSIEKYKEYKKSLILEAVTGKIDLRDYKLEGGEELAEHNNSSQTERECISAVD